MLLIAAAFPLLWDSTGLSQNESPEVDRNISSFEQAVEIIKKYETIHKPQHWPFVGYGHKVLPGEKFSRKETLSEAEAEALLRKDLLKNCAQFREFGADSLLLGTLAYNIGSGATKRSSIVKKLLAGDRDIRDTYISHCRYNGKIHEGIKRRRIEEFDALFEVEPENETASGGVGYPMFPGQLLAQIINPFKLISQTCENR